MINIDINTLNWNYFTRQHAQLFLDCIKRAEPKEPFVYLEVGAAAGETLSAVCAILSEQGHDWSAFAADVPNGWEFKADQIIKNVGAARIEMICFNPVFLPRNMAAVHRRAYICILPNGGLDLMEWMRTQPLHASLAFIDGCHERDCVRADIVAVEKVTRPGSVVIFHDSGIHDCSHVGTSQPHKNQPCGVRYALEDEHLLPCTRPGWELIADTPEVKAGATAYLRTI